MSTHALAHRHEDSDRIDPWQLAPMPASLAREVGDLIARLDERQQLWLAGYLAGRAPSARLAASAAHAVGAASSAAAPVLVLFGSHTGNAEALARRIGSTLGARGVAHAVLDMIDCRKTHLQQASSVIAVVSTHGDGEPPERAAPLLELLEGRKAPRLEHLRFAVLALGDSSYPKFCETGRQLDARLESLGAERLQARADCDVDFEATADAWIETVAGRLADDVAATVTPLIAHAPERRPSAVANAYTRKNPFLAPVLVNQRLTASGSTKDVRHVELSIEGAGLHYEPGDALGIVPRNTDEDVAAFLEALGLDRDAPVGTEAGSETSLFEALAGGREIGRVDLESLRGLEPRALLERLRPLAPRLYSIASSPRATPDEVHLTVAVVDFVVDGRRRRGVASGRIAAATTEDAQLPVYLHRNPGFRLPSDPEAPIVMIGPGTGVAPFRAFVAERAAAGAAGRQWLFFGDRSFETDFLYQAEWIDWRKRGVLSRLDVAFSRDQAEKTYVQRRIVERGADLWRWLEEGAYVYVCGDAERMAPDVHRALIEVIVRHGGSSADRATEYLLDLQRSRRYQRDVY